MRDLVKVFKALSDETRIRILKVLLERECCVCEVMQALNISQSRASRNLGILEGVGFIKSRREGPWIVYSVNEQSMRKHTAKLVEVIKGTLEDSEALALDRERLKTATRVGSRRIDQERG